MTRKLNTFLFLILFISSFTLHGQPSKELFINGGKESLWKGFKRYDFKYNQREARLIVPNSPLPGNPWIWRARFPDWHSVADSILVSEGFYLAYINTNNLYGSPQAMHIWDDFYAFLTNKFSLQKKVALIGVSRGGLFVYNWAKKNPEKVTCIYAEAPVCDFKSWPGGFGQGIGGEKEWEKLKKEYGFETNEEAKAYGDNPIDNLDSLAKAKVPILHMIGLNDEVVPPDENTMVLVNRYLKLGGPATVVPCTTGEQKLNGHHFPIETPQLVADFIVYNTKLPKSKVGSSKYHEIGTGLKNSHIQFEKNKVGRVAFLGGSITYNGGWRDSIVNYLEQRFPETKFEFIAAGIPSMGSTPAAFRLERDVLSKGSIDLLFEEAAVNDATNGRTNEEQVKAMEGIVRHVKQTNPAVDVVMMHFVDPDKMKEYRAGKEPDVILNHNMVANHYNVSSINLAKEVTDRIDAGEFTWQDDFKNLHPTPFGQGIYAQSMIQFLENAYANDLDEDDKIVNRELPSKLNTNCYDNGKLIDISHAKKLKGWSINPSWKPEDGTGTRTNYTDVPMLIGEKAGSTLQFNFQGNVVGIAIAAGHDAGIIEYRIDKDHWVELNLFTRWSKSLHLPWYYTLASGLSEREHTLEIRIVDKKDKKSTGNACRIRYFYINKY
jgi:pimeloyl-ACP methyl ester carboxylesterase/lysophospholipase L1-like esterase